MDDNCAQGSRRRRKDCAQRPKAGRRKVGLESCSSSARAVLPRRSGASPSGGDRRARSPSSRGRILKRPVYKDLSITVIIPCLDEERGIARVLERMPKFVDQIIVV